MKRISLIVMILLFCGSLFSQEENSTVRKGNKKYDDKKYADAEVDYKQAIDIKPESFGATFNLGDALFKQKKYDEAAKEYLILSNKEKDKKKLSSVFYNLGNSCILMGKVDEAIDAYKQALRNNPTDMEAKYNLAFAQKLKKSNDKKKNDKQDKKDQKKDQKQDQKQDQDKNKQDKKDQKKDQQQNKDQISKEDARRMLDALQNDEKKTQEKVREVQKQKAKSVKIEKEW